MLIIWWYDFVNVAESRWGYNRLCTCFEAACIWPSFPQRSQDSGPFSSLKIYSFPVICLHFYVLFFTNFMLWFNRQGLLSTLMGFLKRTSYLKSLKQKHIPPSLSCGIQMVDALRTQYLSGEPRRRMFWEQVQWNGMVGRSTEQSLSLGLQNLI